MYTALASEIQLLLSLLRARESRYVAKLLTLQNASYGYIPDRWMLRRLKPLYFVQYCLELYIYSLRFCPIFRSKKSTLATSANECSISYPHN